jgi:hypothetical protein
MNMLRRYLPIVCLIALLVGPVSGCSEKDKGAKKIRTRDGIAKAINLQKRVVSMTVVDKTGKSRDVQGTFTDETSVWINGREMSVKDIKPNDKVKVSGYQETVGGEKRWVATRVEVTRTTGSDWKSTSQPDGAKPARADDDNDS